MLQNTGAVAVLVLSIFLVIRVVGYFRLVAEGTIPTNSVLTLLILRLLSHLDIIAPLAVYVAMLLMLGRWPLVAGSRDRCRCCGRFGVAKFSTADCLSARHTGYRNRRVFVVSVAAGFT